MQRDEVHLQAEALGGVLQLGCAHAHVAGAHQHGGRAVGVDAHAGRSRHAHERIGGGGNTDADAPAAVALRAGDAVPAEGLRPAAVGLLDVSR